MKATNNSNNNNITFCGLVSGYQGAGNTATPDNAAQAVAEALHTLSVETEVNPAVCVYHTDWGCPVGGEPVGAFILDAPADDTLKICEDLRVALKQSTLTVCLPEKGAKTVGFTAQVEGDLREMGAKWQVAAAAKMAATGTYVSCGIAAEAEGCLTISAEANPQFTPDLQVWKGVVEEICAEIGAEPTFKEGGFNYLHD